MIIQVSNQCLPTLKSRFSRRQGEFVRRVCGMAARMGCVLAGSDRELSSDTFSVGSVIMSGGTTKTVTEAGGKADTEVQPRYFGTAKAGHRGETDRLLRALQNAAAVDPDLRGTISITASTNAVTTPETATSRTASASDAVGAISSIVSEGGGGGASSGSEQVASLMARAGAALQAYARGATHHETTPAAMRSGDNPPPEALVFSLFPQLVATLVASVATGTVDR